MPPSFVSPLERKLKHLPDLLKYVFLGPKESQLVVISSLLSYDQEQELIHVLSEDKGAIGWSVANLKGVGRIVYMYRIYF